MRKLFSFILLFSLALSLFSCHGSLVEKSPKNEKNSESGLEQEGLFEIPENFDTSKNYEISFWAKNDTNMTQVNIYKKAISDFEALYPNIKVNLELYTDYGKIYSDVITNIPTNTTPNVCITYPDHIATYLTGDDTVVPLDELMLHPKYGLGGSDVRFDSPTKDEIIPKFLGECAFGGHYYALPYMRSTEACYINKTYVEKLGYTLPETLTWDFVWEVSRAAMEKDADGNFKVNGQKKLVPFIYKSTDNMMIQYLHQADAPYSNEQGEIFLFNKTTEDLLFTIGEHSKLGAFNTFKRIGYPANFLNAGQCIFAVDSTAGATWMGSNAPLVDIAEENMVNFETAVMTIPQLDPDSPSMISQGPSMCIFNKEDPDEVLASWLFCQFMLTNDVQIAYSQTEGYVPVTSKAQNSAEYLDYLSREGEDNDFYYDIKLKATKLLLDNTENTFVTPVFNGSTSLRNAAGALIETVTLESRQNKKINDSYINDLYSKITSQEKLDQIVTNDTDSYHVPFYMMPIAFLSLSAPAILLISALLILWLCIIIYVIINKNKRKKQ